MYPVLPPHLSVDSATNTASYNIYPTSMLLVMVYWSWHVWGLQYDSYIHVIFFIHSVHDDVDTFLIIHSSKVSSENINKILIRLF